MKGIAQMDEKRLTRLARAFYAEMQTSKKLEEHIEDHRRRSRRAQRLLTLEHASTLTEPELRELFIDSDAFGFWRNKEWEFNNRLQKVGLDGLRQVVLKLVTCAEKGLTPEDLTQVWGTRGLGTLLATELLTYRFPDRYWTYSRRVTLPAFKTLGEDIWAAIPRGQKSDPYVYLALEPHIMRVRWALREAGMSNVDNLVADIFLWWVNQKDASSGTSQVWLFQANPKYYDLVASLRESRVGDENNWVVTRHREEMHPGDTVILWQGGKSAGIYAIGQLTSEPYQRDWEPDQQRIAERPYAASEWWISLRYTLILDEPLSRATIKADPLLQNLAVLKFAQASNYRVSPEEWAMIEELIGKAETSGVDRNSEKSARQIIESLLPDAESRRACLNLMADYIIRAHQHSPATWEVTLFPDRVRLNVGSIQTCVIRSGAIYLVVDAHSLTDQDRAILAQQGTISLETYVTVPDAYDVQVPVQNLSTILSIVRKSCAPLIERAFKGGKRTPYYKSHSPGVIKYMRSFLGRQDIPDPDYGTTSPPSSLPSFDLRVTLTRSLTSRGLTFTPWQIATFYTALQTKGFVILSGISGTGKTKLAQAFAGLLPQATKVALLGAYADPPIEDQGSHDDRQLSAYWWTYPIRDDVEATLVTPFRLYIYHQIQITHVYTVVEFRTQAGGEGIKSPWPDITLPSEVGKTGPDHQPGQKFKTWFKATPTKKLDNPIPLSEVRPLFEYTNHPSALRNALVPIKDPQSDPNNWLFLPVRPDWRDSKSLIGYYNPLTGAYEWTPFLRLLIRAAQNYRSEDRLAWFVILDEMNLAHVEYYFADLLSVLESGRDADGWTREPLRLAYPDQAEGDLPPREMKLPPNLYVVGTVNVDETTHAFSPKVLDRAFTLELTEADFRAYPPQGAGAAVLTGAERQAVLEQFSRGREFARVDKTVVAAWVAAHPQTRDRLQRLNDLLRPYDLHFGYRVFDEIVAFLAAAEANNLYADLGGIEAAFDAAVLMKVLPKFHGSRGKLERPLQNVLAWCVDPNNPDPLSVRQELERVDSTADLAAVWQKWSPQLPATARRVQRMLSALYATGFAAFG